MKKMKKIMAAAIAMMTFSTAATVTGTVAWFVASNVVTASGMSIQAEAEEGIVIAKELASYTDSDWATSTTATHDGTDGTDPLGFIPTSTSTAATWYHGNATNADSYVSTNVTALTVTAPTRVTGYGNGTASVNDAVRNIYLVNEFKVQAVAPSDMAHQDLLIDTLTVTDTQNKELNKSIRVLFKLDSTVKIYNPLDTADFSARGNAGAASHAVASGGDVLLSDGTVPGYKADGSTAKTVYVYIYFEGEDDECKSANIDTINSVTVAFTLKNKTHVNP